MPSLLDSIIRSAASGATFDAANNIAAAGDATISLDSGPQRRRLGCKVMPRTCGYSSIATPRPKPFMELAGRSAKPAGK